MPAETSDHTVGSTPAPQSTSDGDRTTPRTNEQLSTTPKAVTIFDEPERIEAPTTYADSSSPVLATQGPKQHRVTMTGKKLSGRAPLQREPSTVSLNSMTLTPSKSCDGPPGFDSAHAPVDPSSTGSVETRSLLTQVAEWLKDEKERRRKHDRHAGQAEVDHYPDSAIASDSEFSLDKLERILAGFSTSTTSTDRMNRSSRKNSLVGMRRGSTLGSKFKRPSASRQSSDNESADSDFHVPYVDAFLDNTKTMTVTGTDTVDGTGAEKSHAPEAKQKEEKHWSQFKQEIVRLAHTLKIKGWRRVPIEEGSSISVERLSGALTNAVYVVKPPKELPQAVEDTVAYKYRTESKPLELLLRVYGPQVEHLIDRDRELLILRRLAKKNIGPKLLGYFINGRFEEFLHAKTLEPKDVRIPDTSKQIAKRMRELHDGIELLPSEIDEGAMAFRNWDNWVKQCEKVILWLDSQVRLEQNGQKPASSRYTRRGFVCGTEWPFFRQTVERYRKRMFEEYGGEKGLRSHLVFAHNDTQYGNLMRLNPPGDSPLIQPANQHRQLVVIDFEYASANTPGYEFADHFTEWCYNYHTPPDRSYICNTNLYPSLAEQYRFIRSYVMHRPQFAPAASATPRSEGREKTNIPDFMLDARTPGGGPASIDYDAEEMAAEEQREKNIQYLQRETKLWRAANAAQWIAWGIIQAKIPELEETHKKSKTSVLLDKLRSHIHPKSDPLDTDVEALRDATKHQRPDSTEKEEARAEGDNESDHKEGGDDEFDCLGYSHDRAMLFWGDCLQMGIVKESDLPEPLLKQVKIVEA